MGVEILAPIVLDAGHEHRQIHFRSREINIHSKG